MTKSLLLTYVLWLTGGWFGAHHFYLGRDRHAFVWWMTLGGYFGIGWLRDLWRIPEYVKLANRDPAATEQLKEKIRRNAKPVSSTARSVGQMIVSDALGYMVLYALPLDVIPESLLPLAAIPVPLAVAVGKPATLSTTSFALECQSVVKPFSDESSFVLERSCRQNERTATQETTAVPFHGQLLSGTQADGTFSPAGGFHLEDACGE